MLLHAQDLLGGVSGDELMRVGSHVAVPDDGAEPVAALSLPYTPGALLVGRAGADCGVLLQKPGGKRAGPLAAVCKGGAACIIKANAAGRAFEHH